MKKLLLGDQAIAQGALDAGLSGVYAYPGTPSTEITEYIQDWCRRTGTSDIHSRWCTNEKTAMEAALGMSYAGKRALVCMKHVGMNVCADAFVNSAVTGTNGGLVVLAADDPSMHSSQNEQDSRFYGRFALIPILEPSNQQECYDMMSYAFDLSEQLRLPVLMRVVTRLAHSRSVVEISEQPRPQNSITRPADPAGWVLLPARARRKYNELIAAQTVIQESSVASPYNVLSAGEGQQAVVASGIGYNYVMENYPEGAPFPVLKISQYPLPEQTILALTATCKTLLVVEDGQPFIEEQLRGFFPSDVTVHGRLDGALPRAGELNPDNVKAALGLPSTQAFDSCDTVVGRPPALCQGCGHRSVYEALNKVLADYPESRVFGDIGCYTLGALPPYQALHSTVDMGASITMAKGAADAGIFPAVAVIGDSTFTHSGMTGLLDAINENAPITVVISDNLTTGMTGGQDSAGTNKFEAICRGLGVADEHLKVVVPLPANMEEITRILREEIEYRGVSVIIPRRECIQTFARHAREKKAGK